MLQSGFQKIPMIIGQHAFIILSRQQINETDCNRAAVSVRLPNALMRQEKERFTMKGEMTQKGKEALERFKMESASEVGVTLNKGYNGDLTSRQAGSIGGQMVNMMSPEQQFEFIRSDVKSQMHTRILTYSVQVGI